EPPGAVGARAGRRDDDVAADDVEALAGDDPRPRGADEDVVAAAAEQVVLAGAGYERVVAVAAEGVRGDRRPVDEQGVAAPAQAADPLYLAGLEEVVRAGGAVVGDGQLAVVVGDDHAVGAGRAHDGEHAVGQAGRHVRVDPLLQPFDRGPEPVLLLL